VEPGDPKDSSRRVLPGLFKYRSDMLLFDLKVAAFLVDICLEEDELVRFSVVAFRLISSVDESCDIRFDELCRLLVLL
jgi:hypothetical protein